MGRGRAKAKQTKVARDLKYSTGSLDERALERELGSTPITRPAPVTRLDDDEPEYVDRWATDDEDDGPVAAAR